MVKISDTEPRRSARDRIVSVEEVRGWYEAGRTYRWMSEEHERRHGIAVSLTAFSELRYRQGWKPRLTRNTELIPWRVREEHRWHYFLVQLRSEARRRAGKVLSEHEAANLAAFLRDLEAERKVVAYDPESPEGFSRVTRRKTDTDIIRRPRKSTTRRER